MSYFPKPSLNENDLAIIERGATAAHSIEAGQYVTWHGKTGKAKAAILQGATLSDSLFDYDEDGILNVLSGSNVLQNAVNIPLNSVYTFPSDGYIQISCGYQGSYYGIARITDANGTPASDNGIILSVSSTAGTLGVITTLTNMLLVRKGMKCYCTGNGAAALFYPFAQ